MQVRHETQLIESLPKKPDDFSAQQAQTSQESIDTYTIRQICFNPINYISCCPVNNLVAVYNSKNQQIILLDTRTYLKREKFPLKSCDKKFSKHSFTLKGLDFSPDGLKLAIGQSDCIIYIYKLPNSFIHSQNNQTEIGSLSNQKPTISGKFVCSSPITSLLWAEFGILFGTQDGKVKLILVTNTRSSLIGDNLSSSPGSSQPQANQNSSTNSSSSSSKVINLYVPAKNSSMPVSLAAKYPIVAIGFADGRIQLINLSGNSDFQAASDTNLDWLVGRRNSSNIQHINQSSSMANIPLSIQHSCTPNQMIIIQNNIICCAGSDGRLVLHNVFGSQISCLQSIELREDILGIDFSAINEILAIVTATRLLFVKFDLELNNWQLQSSFIESDSSIHSLTSVKWLKDGTQLVIGTLSGSLELFQCSWNKQASIGDQLEICHIAKNRVRITDRARNLLATYKTQYDIKRVNILDNGQSVIIWTLNSLFLANANHQGLQSEIPWNSRDKGVKFSFKNPGYVLIFNSSSKELIIVKLGQDSLLYSIKYELISNTKLKNRMICVRQYPPILFPQTSSNAINQQQQDKNSSSPTQTPGRQRSANSRSRIGSLVSDLQVKNLMLDSLREKLAYVSQSDQLTVVDLKTKTKEIEMKQDETPNVTLVDFSNTCNYLMFVCGSSRELNLISLSLKSNLETRKNLVNNNQTSKYNIQVLIKDCCFAQWLPQSDILIAQSKHNVYIWYDIENLRDISTIDTRSCNPANLAPILDLSLIKKNPHPVIKKLHDESIILSNKQTIQLDRIKVRFYNEIADEHLESACDLLSSNANCSDKVRKSLLNKLGWIAINKANCQVAINAFKMLNYTSMVHCLERCLEVSEPEEREWRLSMIRGDWDTFEQIADSEHIILTYKRLNKWSRLIEYLTRSQQFRQRDLVEQEYRKWLIDKDRFQEAAESLIKAGDLHGALNLLVTNNKLDEALELFVKEMELKSSQIVVKSNDNNRLRTHIDDQLNQMGKLLKVKFNEMKEYKKEAIVCDKILEQPKEALDLYLKANSYDEALKLCKTNNLGLFNREKLIEIEDSYAKHLLEGYKSGEMTRTQALPAIDLLIEAKLDEEALLAAVQLEDLDRAYQILMNGNIKDKKSSQVSEYCDKIGQFMLNKGKLNEAIDVYLINENFDLVIKICLDQGNYEKAFEIAQKNVYGDDVEKTCSRFLELASEMEKENKDLEKAEKIYFLAKKVDLAIEMHRKHRNWDRMLEIIEQYEPDSLESNLLLLARQMESENKFDLAEKYLLKASETEWTNAVRMYRLAGNWKDAFRVAKEHCSSAKDPLLVQLAFWWAKSMANEDIVKARLLLYELDLFKLVVEFCCDNKNYQFAIDLCNTLEEEMKRKEVIRRFAVSLEEGHKFKEAEEMLVREGQFEEAVGMYVDNEMYQEAIQLIEELQSKKKQENINRKQGGSISIEESEDQSVKLVDLLNSTLIKCADRIADEIKPSERFEKKQMFQLTNGFSLSSSSIEKLQRAQQLYLRAQRPELAVELYKERGMWQEAIQVAQRFAPQLLESVESAFDAQVAEDVGPILAEVQSNRQTLNQSRSSSSSRTSLLSSHSSNSTVLKLQNNQSEVNSSQRRTFKQITGNYLQNKAESSLRNGDVRQTKLALSKFMDTLIDGQGHLIEARIVRMNSWLQELRKLVSLEGKFKEFSSQQLSNVIKLADKIISHASWGSCLVEETIGQKSLEDKNISSKRDNRNTAAEEEDLEFVVWLKLRNVLVEVWNILKEEEEEDRELVVEKPPKDLKEVKEEEGEEADDNYEERFELVEQFKRRLLITHYVSLHGCLVKQLHLVIMVLVDPDQVSFKQQQRQELFGGGHSSNKNKSRDAWRQSGASVRAGAIGNVVKGLSGKPEIWPANLSVGQAERLKSQLASSRNEPLVKQLVKLIGKLSLSLLRYTDVLEAGQAFQVAGFWLLVSDRPHFARFVWVRLMELIGGEENHHLNQSNGSTNSNLNSSNTSGSRVELELEKAGIPLSNYKLLENNQDEQDVENHRNNQLSPSMMDELRQWLVERLIESSGRRLSLDERGQIESSLYNGSRQKSLEPCLVSGYPVIESEKLFLSAKLEKRSFNQVRRREWEFLLMLLSRRRSNNNNKDVLQSILQSAKKNSGSQLEEMIDFIVRLSGADSKVLHIK